MADFAAAARFTGKRKTRQNRVIFIALGIVLAVLFGECIFQFILAPNMRIENIIIDNDSPLHRDEILSAAGLQGQHYYFRVDGDAIQTRLEALPAVKSARIEKIFPGSLRVAVAGRRPIACAFAENAEGMLPVAFDEEGVVFLEGAAVPETGLPVVSGIRFEGFRSGLRLPPMLTPFLGDLANLQRTSPSLLAAFSELKVVRKGDEQFEYVAYPVYHRVPVRMEGELSAQRCKTALIVLDALKQEGLLGWVEEIDFRTEDIVYRMKEG
ncbi:MAG: FtsQ-type POTRA domain-containing protein [Spirochaetaceae bacterium]|nr:FtsQ-type POTRA domain-containing protein [Spirochaetaceae bacterium]